MFNRYYGFVNFATPEAAVLARSSLNGVSLGSGKQARLYVARFQSKDERTASLSKSGSGSAHSSGSYSSGSYSSGSYSSGSYSSGSTTGASKDGRNVYVKHLAPEVDENVLFQLFQA